MISFQLRLSGGDNLVELFTFAKEAEAGIKRIVLREGVVGSEHTLPFFNRVTMTTGWLHSQSRPSQDRDGKNKAPLPANRTGPDWT